MTGTRYIPGAGVFGWNFYRKLTSRVANFIASTALGTAHSDLTGSFRLYKKYASPHSEQSWPTSSTRW